MGAVPPTRAVTRRPSEPRARLLRTASDLFYREGIHRVGVDRVLAEAGVTRATMYRHFPGKEALVVAYLEGEDATVRQLLADAVGAAEAAGAARADGSPADVLGAVIEAIAHDATTRHTRGCPFLNASAEFPDADSPVRVVVRRQRDWFRETMAELATAAGVARPGQVAAALVLLRDAMLVGAYLEGDTVADTFRATARSVAGL